LVVRTPSAEIAQALERHIVRRVQATQRVIVRTSTDTADSCWRDGSAQLGVSQMPADPVAAARTLCEAAHQSVIVVLGDVRDGTWDHAVLHAIESTPNHVLVVVLRWGEPVRTTFGSEQEIYVGGNQDDVEAWWGGVVQEAMARESAGNIADLDAWWSWSSRQMDNVPRPDLTTLSDDARALVARLRLAGRAWPARWKETLGTRTAWFELVELDVVVQHAGHLRLSLSAGAIEQEPTNDDLKRVADTLRTRFAQEPWALARAGVLYTRAGERAHGEACLQQSLRALDDALARHEVWAGWRQALAQAPREGRREGALCAAELALERDDVDTALELAHLAGGGDTNASFQAQYVLGRAQLARGDMVAARVSLERAFARSSCDNERAASLAQLAETSYVVGDLDEAARKAREASTLATDVAIMLDASNTSGKVMLARAQWSEAEAHFAGNESTAAAAELDLAQLRARVNRAIALLSKGQAETARGILDAVLQDGERRHDLRATAFALSNLAVLAIERHDYADALTLSERAIETRRRLGDKVGLARVVTNLAELRLRLGLLPEAEQTLAFGRHALRPGIPPTRAAHFALVAARIRLARGDTFEASREIGAALADAEGASDGAMVGECYRVETRIALEDGDVERAKRSIREAEARADKDFAQAEVALLRAKLAQAVGQDAIELADDALTAARRANDEDLLREASLLMAELYRIDGRTRAARRHVDAALQIRDRVIESLPASLRPRYLARRDLQRLSAVDDAVHMMAAEPASTKTERPAAQKALKAHSAGFVGRHASVVRLLTAVGKVAPSSAPILICGESGTGKELIAEALHAQSDRREGPLVKVNCAALVDTLLLSELFGHEKGAFTGAAARRRGRFEMADGGTLFLDEIGDISPRTQVALLRVLQDNTFERVGGGTTLRSDVRVVCATHRDLKQMVADGTFREDLFYRLSGVTLRVPALHDRMSDLSVLADHLLHTVAVERSEAAKRLTPEAVAVMQRHRWPGNVRELDNVLRAASLFSETDDISAETLLEHVPVRAEDVFTSHAAPVGLPRDESVVGAGFEPARSTDGDTGRLAYDLIRNQGTSLGDLKRNIERECIRQALVDTDGNITRAASLLGMKRPRLSQLVKQYSLLESSSEDAL
jgi:DNA-binding NtrC family response regulator/tetratricopeptide (TPR) repeat protein